MSPLLIGKMIPSHQTHVNSVRNLRVKIYCVHLSNAAVQPRIHSSCQSCRSALYISELYLPTGNSTASAAKGLVNVIIGYN